jgi:hypothetical protein
MNAAQEWHVTDAWWAAAAAREEEEEERTMVENRAN